MFRSGARIALASMAVPLALLLAGCDTTGTIEVRSPTELGIDLTLTDYPRGNCNNVGSTDTEITVERGIDASGKRYCRMHGTLKTESVYGVQILPVGDYYVVSLDLGENTEDPGTVDITLTLPGTVLASSSGTISGNTVRLTGQEPLREDFELVARAGPETPWVPIAGGAGLALGVAGALLVRRRRGRTAAAPVPPTEPDQGAPPDAPPAQPHAEGTAADDWSDERPRPATDPTFWSRPPVPENPAPAAAAEDDPPGSRPPVDHSIWGPPAAE
nr:hypothetical protein [Propionicimonas sp.]